jgi:hypothetical protein
MFIDQRTLRDRPSVRGAICLDDLNVSSHREDMALLRGKKTGESNLLMRKRGTQ